MHSNDFEDMFFENEKAATKDNLEEMIEESENKISDSHGTRPSAFPQDGWTTGHTHTFPEWLLRNKKFQGLSGFVTLGGLGFDENNQTNLAEFESMDIQSLIPQEFNFNLGRMFNERENQEISRKPSMMGEPMEGYHHHGGNGTMQTEKVPKKHSFMGRKHSKSQEKIPHGDFPPQEEKLSFFKGYLPMLLEHHWKEILDNSGKFIEFEKAFDCQKNCENLMYLEEHKETYGNSFENIYSDHYLKMMNKIRECVEGFSLTGETLVKILHDEFCGLFSELFNFIKNCSSDYCFSLMKNKNKTAKAEKSHTQSTMQFETQKEPALSFAKPTQSQTSQIKNLFSQSTNWGDNSNHHEENKGETTQLFRGNINETMSIENLESLANIIDYNVGRKTECNLKSIGANGSNNLFQFKSLDGSNFSEIESVSSDNTRKMQRKYWSAAELRELDSLSSHYYPTSIPIEKLEEFARKYSRTLNAIQSKISKTKKEKVKKQSLSTKNEILNGGGGPRNEGNSSQRRYEVTVERMIQGALQNFPNCTATKEEVIEKIKEMFFQGAYEVNDDRLRNSISQTLSSNKNIGVIKGTYGLRSREYLILDSANAKTMKSRLQYILSTANNYQLDIVTIRRLYWEYFSDTVMNDKVWETSITKILKQSHEFDNSQCKTKYCLLVKDPPI